MKPFIPALLTRPDANGLQVASGTCAIVQVPKLQVALDWKDRPPH